MHDFIRAHVEGTTTRDLCRMLKEATGVEMSEGAMKSYKTNHKLKSGTPGGLPKGHPSERFPEHIKDYILKHHRGVGPKEMTEKLNKAFGRNFSHLQIKGYYANHGISSGLTGRFQPGHIPANKGTHPPTRGRMAETQFKVGHTPSNKLPIGSIIMKADGYMWQKIGEGARDWRQKHLLVWEEANGPIPAGLFVTFKDGDRTNYELENLALVTMAENIELNRRGLRTEDKELTETGILVARLNCNVSKKRRRNKEDKQNAE